MWLVGYWRAVEILVGIGRQDRRIDGCYKIEGRDIEGRKIDVKLDPATLQIVETDSEDDDDDRGGARNPAPAGTVAPPQNGLFGNGAPPQVQVN